MIGRLSGVIIEKQPPMLLLDVNGVGYEVQSPMSTFYELPAQGQQVQLLIHTHVREDAFQLFGFATDVERRFFQSLIKISGVGAKMALTILSGVSAEHFAHYVQHEDSSALTKLPGVGTKTAQRLVIEMKDKLEKDVFGGKATLPISAPMGLEGAMPLETPAVDPAEEAVNALVALGYKAPEASKMIRAIAESSDTTEQLIRKALQRKVQ